MAEKEPIDTPHPTAETGQLDEADLETVVGGAWASPQPLPTDNDTHHSTPEEEIDDKGNLVNKNLLY